MTEKAGQAKHSPKRLSTIAAPIAAVLIALALAPAAFAKEPVDFFGNPPGVSGSTGGLFEGSGISQGGIAGAVAVNDSGAGAGDAGDVYVLDPFNDRIQRFGRDDKGTPADLADDTYFFISAWGADVVQPGGAGDLGNAAEADYEVCAVASQCKAGVASAGNGSVAGDGSLDLPAGSGSIAVDQDTGEVYVNDAGNHRVNVYAGDGTFLRSFGNSVVQSGPGNVAAPDEVQTLTVKAGGGKFSLEFEGETTGARAQGRGCTSPGAGSKLIQCFDVISGAFEVGQGVSVLNGSKVNVFPRGTTITEIGAETVTASDPATGTGGAIFGHDLPPDASAQQLEDALNSLPTIAGAGGSVTVSGGPGDESGSSPYTIAFDGGSFAGADVPQLVVRDENLTSSATPEASVATTTQGGAYEVCVAADGDVCRTGAAGSGAGQLGAGTLSYQLPGGIALSPPDGNATSGAVFLADTINHRVNTYGLDGSAPAEIGSAAQFDAGDEDPTQVAVDSRGILYTGADERDSGIERYDTTDANGAGVGFLAPIPLGVDERQEVTIDATGGTFTLSFDPDEAGPEPAETTVPLPFDAPPYDDEPYSGPHTPGVIDTVNEALGALPSIGGDGNALVGGGPGMGGAFNPYSIHFAGGLGAADLAQLTVDDSNLTGGTGASVTTTTQGQPGLLPNVTQGLAVDPDEDGAGPDTDVLYALRLSGYGAVQQFGPANPPGLSAPPTADDARHGTTGVYRSPGDVAVEPSSGRLYVPAIGRSGDGGGGVYVLGEPNPVPPSVSLDSLSDVDSNSIAVHATIDPNGAPDTSYRIEYSNDGGASWQKTPTTVLGHQEDPQAIDETLQPPPVGLDPLTEYTVRVVIRRRFSTEVKSNELTATTDPAPPLAETTGAPIRTTTTADLSGRVTPSNSATTYRFEYGEAGPCDTNPCQSTAAKPAGSDNVAHLVAERLAGLAPDTTYHYRLLADNGTGAEVAGADMSVHTRATEELPNQSDAYPGPPNSDRAWEMVSLPDSGGNPIGFTQGFSDSGSRAIYGIFGGTPISVSGSAFGTYFAQRPAGAHPSEGWQTQSITPPRDQVVSANWSGGYGPTDLSSIVSSNAINRDGPLWRLSPGAPAKLLFSPTASQTIDQLGKPGVPYGTSADATRTVVRLKGTDLDPAHPAAGSVANLYDVSDGGTPRLVSLLPGGQPPACGVDLLGSSGSYQDAHWISAEGSRVYFASRGDRCSGPLGLYLREIGAGQSKSVSGQPLSGLDCEANFLRSTAEAVFFTTASRLVAEDSEPAGGCPSLHSVTNIPYNDIYRYELDGGALECLTCLKPGLEANVGGASPVQIAVSEDGSRIYFPSQSRLAPGAPAGESSIYRLEPASGRIDYVAPGDEAGPEASGVELTPDGSRLVLTDSGAALDPLGGPMTNGGKRQYYLYDDGDRSLSCVSCPRDGSAPLSDVPTALSAGSDGANKSALAANGTFAFSTDTPLLGADQNTPSSPASSGSPYQAGRDVYEYRDGRLALISDGLAERIFSPTVEGISPTGKDVFFSASAQYTADAIDNSRRLYDARIGGGIEFPEPPPPCPLEVCQGTPRGAPPYSPSASRTVQGSGNPGPQLGNCAAPARRAKRLGLGARRLAHRAKAIRRRAARSSALRRTRRAQRRAQRLAKAARRRAGAAKRQRARAKRCRAANARRANR